MPVTITGPQPLALEAQELIQQIIASKTSFITQRVKDIPAHILPFLIPQRAKFLEAAQGGDVQLQLNQETREISVNGDREAVERVIETIKSARDFFQTELTSVKLMLPKRQHRLLTGKGAEEIMAKSRCVVIVQSFEEPGEEVNVYGRGSDIGTGASAVIEKANSAYIHEFPLPGPIAVSRQLLTYMTRVEYPKTLSEENPDVAVYTPPVSTIQKATVLNVDLVGEKPAVDAAVRQLSQLLGKLIGATKDVSIDWLVHHFVNSHKNAKKYVLLSVFCRLANSTSFTDSGRSMSSRTFSSSSLRSLLSSPWSFLYTTPRRPMLLPLPLRRRRSSRRSRPNF